METRSGEREKEAISGQRRLFAGKRACTRVGAASTDSERHAPDFLCVLSEDD